MNSKSNLLVIILLIVSTYSFSQNSAFSLVDTSQIRLNAQALLFSEHFPWPYISIRSEDDLHKAIDFFTEVEIKYLKHNLPNKIGELEYVVVELNLLHEKYELLTYRYSRSPYIACFFVTEDSFRIYKLSGFQASKSDQYNFISGLNSVLFTNTLPKRKAFKNSDLFIEQFDISEAIKYWRRK